jgi:hypothetical protein
MISIGIVGSRNFPNELKVRQFVQTLPSDWELVSGGANGPDLWAEEEFRARGMAVNIHYPNWKALGKSAGFIRNTLIVNDSNLIVAFYNNTNGTKNTMQQAVKARKPLFTVTAEDDLPTVEEMLKKVFFTGHMVGKL